MRNGTISDRILDALRQNAEGDEAVKAFLIDILYKEAEGLRGRTELYEQLIARHCDSQEVPHED